VRRGLEAIQHEKHVMKRFIALSLAALALALLAQQPASAWSNIRFKAGIDLQWQSGNNSWFWGAFTSGQYPSCCSTGGGMDYGYGYQSYPYGYGAAAAYPYGAAAGPSTSSPPPVTSTPPAGTPSGGGTPSANRVGYTSWYGSGYQPVGYFYPGNSNPMTNSGGNYYSVPSYWYGNR
jgi:hypothetical protein